MDICFPSLFDGLAYKPVLKRTGVAFNLKEAAIVGFHITVSAVSDASRRQVATFHFPLRLTTDSTEEVHESFCRFITR